MDKLPPELCYHICSFLCTEDNIKYLINFRMTNKKFYNNQEIKRLLYTSETYLKIMHDIDLGYTLATVNTYDIFVHNFTEIDTDKYRHVCLNCNHTISDFDKPIIYDVKLPKDYLPLIYYYNNRKRKRENFNITYDYLYQYTFGMRLGIIKACNEFEFSRSI